MVDGKPFLVALAHFGEDVDPGLGLHTVVGLDVQRSLGLNDLKHLGHGEKAQRDLRAKHPPGPRSPGDGLVQDPGPQREMMELTPREDGMGDWGDWREREELTPRQDSPGDVEGERGADPEGGQPGGHGISKYFLLPLNDRATRHSLLPGAQEREEPLAKALCWGVRGSM